jgi:hypothetical protein
LGGGTIIKKKKNESYLKLLVQFCNQYPKAELKIFGSGVADPELALKIGFPIDKIAWRDILNTASFISARGIKSKSELIRWGIDREIMILHDLAVNFKKDKVKSKK